MHLCLQAECESVVALSEDRGTTEENKTVMCPALRNSCPRLNPLIALERGKGAHH